MPDIRKRLQRGDTLVEVMICLAILGLSLTIAFSIASKSLLAARNAQEHADALHQIAAQVELIRADAVDPNLYQGGTFCMDPATAKPVPSTNAACTLKSLFQVSYEYTANVTGVAVPQDVFTVTITWPGVGQLGQQREQYSYKLHQLTNVGGNSGNGGNNGNGGGGGGGGGAPAPTNVAQGGAAINNGGAPDPTYSTAMGYTIDKISDGDLNTMYYPGGASFDVTVNLGSKQKLNSITAVWKGYGFTGPGTLYINNYTIRVSSDNVSWSTVGSGGIPNANTTVVTGNFNNVQYIRVTASSPFDWIGIYEIQAT